VRVEVLTGSSNCWSGRCRYQQCFVRLVRTNPYYTPVSQRRRTSNTQLQVGLYCRVSHDPTGRGTSVADQEKEGHAWCATNGHVVAWVVIDDDMSASRYNKKARPGFNIVKEKLAGADPVDIVWTWESSRLQRDLEVYVQIRALCERYEVLWSYHGRLYDMSRADDRFSTGLDALVDERASHATSDRVQRAVNARVAAGTAHGRIPYGYRAVYHPNTGTPIGREPDPDTAPVVREIVRRVLCEEPSYRIAKNLNERGVISPHGFRLQRTGKAVDDARPWTIGLVRQIAVNAAYAALRTHNGEFKGEATWAAIISADDHRRVVARFSDPARTKNRDRRDVRHLLTGVVACGVCGATCRRVMNHGSPSYQCRAKHCVSRLQFPVDALVTEALLMRLEQPHVRELFTDAEGDTEIAAAVQELEELEARLAGIRKSVRSLKGMADDELTEALAHYLPLIADARRRTVPTHIPEVVRDLIDAEDVRGRWGVLGWAQRRSVVRHLMVVTILPTASRGSHGFDPDCIKVQWR
jgi:site-specific DNA recombinase